MDRRKFLKRTGQVIAGLAAVPSLLRAKKPRSKPQVGSHPEKFNGFQISSLFAKAKEPKLTEDMWVDVFNKMPQARLIETTSIYLIEWSGKPHIIRTEIEHEEFIRAALKKQNFPGEKICQKQQC